MRKIPPGVGPKSPQVVVVVGATGDLSRRKLLPGPFHLTRGGLIPGCRIVGVSLGEREADGFRAVARDALAHFASRPVAEPDWAAFSEMPDDVPLSTGPSASKAAVARAEVALEDESRRIHDSSVPPNAAPSALRPLGEAGLVEKSRIVSIAFCAMPKSMFRRAPAPAPRGRTTSRSTWPTPPRCRRRSTASAPVRGRRWTSRACSSR